MLGFGRKKAILADAQEAYRVFDAREAIKVVLSP